MWGFSLTAVTRSASFPSTCDALLALRERLRVKVVEGVGRGKRVMMDGG